MTLPPANFVLTLQH